MDAVKRLRTDVNLCFRGLAGKEGDASKNVETLKSAPGFKLMETDLATVLEDARKMSTGVLMHRTGEYTELSAFDGKTEAGLDTLADMDKAMEDLRSRSVSFPQKTPDTMEGDQICQLCVLIMTLEFSKKHMAEIVHSAIKRT